MIILAISTLNADTAPRSCDNARDIGEHHHAPDDALEGG